MFHSRCQGFMDACHTPRSCSDVKFLEAHPFHIDYLISVNSKLNLIKTLNLMCCLCGVFFYFKDTFLESLTISTNDDLICRDITKYLL